MNNTIREARMNDAESITRVLNPIIEARANSVVLKDSCSTLIYEQPVHHNKNARVSPVLRLQSRV